MSTVALAVMLTGTGWGFGTISRRSHLHKAIQLSSVAFHSVSRSSIRALQCNVGTTFERPSRQDVAPGYCEVTAERPASSRICRRAPRTPA